MPIDRVKLVALLTLLARPRTLTLLATLLGGVIAKVGFDVETGLLVEMMTLACSIVALWFGAEKAVQYRVKRQKEQSQKRLKE